MDPEFLKSRVLKSFRHVPPRDLPESPVHALKGLSETDARLLYDSFYVKTIRDLADLKYVRWAQEICALRDVPQEKIDMSSFRDKLIKAYEQTPIRKLMRSPVHALQGLSEADGKRLHQAFRVRTVQNLARLKFAHYAHEICREAYADLSAPIRPGDPGGPTPPPRIGGAQLATIPRRALVLLGLFGAMVVLIALVFLGRHLMNGPPAAPRNSAPLPSSDGAGQTPANSAGSTQSRNTPEKIYIVRFQDSLSAISKRVYGTPARWPEIHKLNRDVVKDPHRIFPGTKLRLP